MAEMTRGERQAYMLAELATVQELAGDDELNMHGLTTRRAWLRHPSTIEQSIDLALGERRAVVLDLVSRRLAASNGAIEYYRGAGDLLDPMPDDLAGLDDDAPSDDS